MSYFFSLVGAFLLLAVLILVHELGHFVVGRLLKFKILEFSIGFGPLLFSRTRKEIQYSVRLLPLGGYCRFYGEDEGSSEDGEDGRSMYNEKAWKRLLVMLSGCMMNFVVAFLMAVTLLSAVGVPATDNSVGQLTEDGAAKAAGLQVGDKIVAVNGVDTPEADDVVREVTATNGASAVFTIQREQGKQDVAVTPIFNEEEQRYMIGIYFGTTRMRVGLLESVGVSATYCKDVTVALVDFLRDLIFHGQGASELSGPIGTVAIVTEMTQAGFKDSFLSGLENILQLGILLSMNLGVLNLLPLPALDGGRVLFVLFEMIFRRRVKPEHEALVHLVGMALLFGLAILIGYQDIVKLIAK